MFFSKFSLKTSLLTFAIAICGSMAAVAQHQYNFRYNPAVKVVIGTDTLKTPWNGGLNSPVYNTMELNHDNREDLVIFDRTTHRVFTYLAVNNNGTWEWQYKPEYEIYFQVPLNGWMLLRDYNCDGLKDIFTVSPTWDIRVYKQDTLNGQISFSNPYPTLNYRYPGQTTDSNMYQDGYSLPAIDDIDNDGDLDILAMDFGGVNEVWFYKNQRVEQNLSCDSLKYTLDLNPWGGINKCIGICGGFTFGRTCKVAKPLHAGGNTLLTIDLDNDGDKDLLIGEDMCANMVKLTNFGTAAAASFNASSVHTTYPTTNPISLPNFPAGFYEDVNFDGKKDLLVSPFLFNNQSDRVNMHESSWLYSNTGTSQVPAFSFSGNSFLQELDLGEGAYPTFADIDADGDLDLIVGNLASTRHTYYSASLALFRNVGSATNPIFKLEDYDYLDLSIETYQEINPVFADINNDGALDLVFSSSLGTGSMRYILNTASANQPMQFNRSNIQTFPVGYNVKDKPVFYDLDNDGDLDLLIGKSVGNIEFFRNTGTAANPIWTLETSTFGDIKINSGRQHIALAIANLNANPLPELITSDDSGEIRVYEDFTSNLNGVFVPQSMGVFNEAYQDYMFMNLGTETGIAVADLNGDQKLELIVGSHTGGLQLFSFENIITTGVKSQLQALSGVNLYPNPATSQLTIEADEAVAVVIFDLAGKKVLENENTYSRNLTLDISAVQPGMYLVQLQSKDGRSVTQKLLIQH